MAVFMGGLALGAICRMMVFQNVTYLQFIWFQIVMGILAILMPGVLTMRIVQSGIAFTLGVVLLFILVIAFAAGILFSIAVHIRTGRLTDNVAALYSADLIGSALGAFLTSVFLIPLLGVMNTSYLIGGLLLLYALILFLRRKHFR